jgi:hypothetical protein
MGIHFRNYESVEDLDLQYEFWNKITQEMPYAWKPTLSPRMFKDQREFHPKSRYFAFNGDKLVGYMSFTGQGNFVSLGFPWVLPGYEGELQDELFDKVFSFAVSEEYGGRNLAQRFRSQWEKPIHYFLSKGFEITGRSPIVGINLTKPSEGLHAEPELVTEIKDAFEFKKWKQLKTLKPETTASEITMMEQYYQSVDFDYSLECSIHGKPAAYFGVTIRKDTGYSEILAAELDSKYLDYFSEMISVLENESYTRGARMLSISESYLPAQFNRKGYNIVTEDLMLMMSV